MRKNYLLVYNDGTGTREQIKEWIDNSPLIQVWRFDLPHCFHIVSTSTAKELSDSLRTATGGNGRHFITEVSSNRQGWLTKRTWHVINHKRLPPDDAE